MVNAPGTEPSLRDLEPATLAEQQVRRGHANVLEHDLGVPVRGVVEPEHGQRTHDPHAGRIHGHQDHRLLLVARRAGVAPAHEDGEPAARIAGTRDPPLAPVDDVVIAISRDRRLDVRGIRRRHVRLRHRKAGTDLAGKQRLQPLPFLPGRAVPNQYFHVSGIGRRAIEDLRSTRRAPPHDFAERRVLRIREPGTVFALRQKQVPQPLGTGPGLELLDDRDRLPPAARFDLVLKTPLVRVHVRVHERRQALLQIFRFR